MNTARAESISPVRVPAHNTVTQRLGHWTTAQAFEVRAHRGHAVLDLRSPQIPAGDIAVEVVADHAVVTLLVADDATIEDWDLRRIGRAKVKDAERPRISGGRRVVVSGEIRSGEIRVRRAGLAVLTAVCSREFFGDLRRARAEGSHPTVADPAHAA